MMLSIAGFSVNPVGSSGYSPTGWSSSLRHGLGVCGMPQRLQ